MFKDFEDMCREERLEYWRGYNLRFAEVKRRIHLEFSGIQAETLAESFGEEGEREVTSQHLGGNIK